MLKLSLSDHHYVRHHTNVRLPLQLKVGVGGSHNPLLMVNHLLEQLTELTLKMVSLEPSVINTESKAQERV